MQRQFFADQGPSSQSYGFSSSHVSMWELDYKESWAPKNWCFWTVVLEKTLESPWPTRGSNQSTLKEISPGFSLEGLMLKLKLQYFGHRVWRIDSFEKTLMLGQIEGRQRRGDRGWDGWMASLTQWTWVWVISGSWRRTGRPGVLQSTESQELDTTERLNRNDLMNYFAKFQFSSYFPAFTHLTYLDEEFFGSMLLEIHSSAGSPLLFSYELSSVFFPLWRQ